MSETEIIAIALRDRAFPGASDWGFATQDVRDRWIRAAEYTEMLISRAKDKVLREAIADAHALEPTQERFYEYDSDRP